MFYLYTPYPGDKHLNFCPKVTLDAAKERAEHFFGTRSKANTARKTPRNAPQLVLANDSRELYIFNDEANGGYVVVSGDERMPDVLGYSYDGHFDANNVPCNMQAWLEDCAHQITHLQAQSDAKATKRSTTSRANISPLLTCGFGQSYPYNNKCPVVDGEHCFTGCVATAMAQIMHYYKWPQQTTQIIPGYTTWKLGIEMPAMPITTINWDNILNGYSAGESYSGEQIDAISTLMLLCGASINMNYTPSGSDNNTLAALCALRDYFNYDELLEEVNRGEGVDDDSDDWGDLIYDELNCGRPVLYSGYSEEWGGGTSHAFVIDGYENGFFHANWGWESFTAGHSAVLGIQPAYPETPQMYGVFNNGKLTLYYDNEKVNRSGIILSYLEDWSDYKEKIIECVIDPSFANLKKKMYTEFFNGWSNMKSIEGMENLNTSMAWNMCYMFCGCSSLTNLDLSNFKTDKVRDMSGTFTHCSSLTSLDVSNFKTDNVQFMDYLFYGCSGLTSLDVSGFKTDNVTDMFGLFGECSSLTDLDLSGFNADKVTNLGYLFGWCNNLTQIDLSGLNTDNVTNMSYLFEYCSNLSTIYVSDGWNTKNVDESEHMFAGCFSLIGGAGTQFSWEYDGLDYAHVDGGPDNPGYLTYKVALEPEIIPTRAEIQLGAGKTMMGYSYDKTLDFSNVTNGKAWIAAGFVENSKVMLCRVNIVPANTGFIVTCDTPGDKVIAPVSNDRAYYANLLVPILEQQTIYPTQIINGVEYTFMGIGTIAASGKTGFVKVNNERSYGPNKCLLRVPTQYLVSQARGLDELEMVFDDATGIREKVTVKSEQFATAPVYNLNGQRVSKAQSGLYIQNGKKMIMR